MSAELQIAKIEALIAQLLQEEPTYFLVSVQIKPTNNIKVYLDGDQGIAIEKCVHFNKQLYKLIEEEGYYPEGEFSLELSSPGIEQPLKLHRQYLKNKGRNIEVLFNDDTSKIGLLLEVTETDIIVEHTEGKGKKMVTQQLVIPFSTIKSTTIQIKF